jgi:hypothetical protein
MFNLNLPSRIPVVLGPIESDMTQDEIVFYGHPNVLCTHQKTIEITKMSSLSLKGDCIIGVRANKACKDLSPSLRVVLQKPNSFVNIEIHVNDLRFTIKGRTSDGLSLLSDNDIVIRKSTYTCPRTVAILSDNACSDIPREIVELLKDPERQGIMRITIE